MSNFEIDSYKFQPQGDSPVENDWRSAAPRCSDCGSANLDEDEGCLDADCLAERSADDAERLTFVGKLTEVMIAAGAQEVTLPTDEVSICPGYQFPAGTTCGASKDEDKLYCDTCIDQIAYEAREREAEAYQEEYGVAPFQAYPSLTDKEIQ